MASSRETMRILQIGSDLWNDFNASWNILMSLRKRIHPIIWDTSNVVYWNSKAKFLAVEGSLECVRHFRILGSALVQNTEQKSDCGLYEVYCEGALSTIATRTSLLPKHRPQDNITMTFEQPGPQSYTRRGTRWNIGRKYTFKKWTTFVDTPAYAM